MSQIISVVPNICEGRDEAFIDALRDRLAAMPGLVVLDVSMDQVRNRTVFSFTGTKDAIFEGGFVLYREALGRIDMRQHQGEYPRIGAVDVFPFVALLNITVGNYTETPLYRILEGVKTELTRFGTGVSRVEMVGLVPQNALLDSALHYLQVMGFSPEDILEHRLAGIVGEQV